MSSTNSSNRLTLLSYATFNHHIPIHDSFMKTAPVKTDRDNGSFSIISLTECQKDLSEGQFGKQTCDTCLELTFVHKALVLIPTRIGDFTYFIPGHFLGQWNLTTVSSAAQMEGVYGDSYVR